MRCDVWAVGVIVYTVIAGDLPYDVPKQAVEDGVVHPARTQGVAMSSPQWNKVSITAKDFVKNLLHVDPLLRPSSSEALEQLRADAPVADVEVTKERRMALSESRVSSK